MFRDAWYCRCGVFADEIPLCSCMLRRAVTGVAHSVFVHAHLCSCMLTTAMAYRIRKVQSLVVGRSIQAAGTWRNTMSCPNERFDCRVVLVPSIIRLRSVSVQLLFFIALRGLQPCPEAVPAFGGHPAREVHGHSGGQHGATNSCKLGRPAATKVEFAYICTVIKSIAGGRNIHTGTWRSAMSFPTMDLISSPC